MYCMCTCFIVYVYYTYNIIHRYIDRNVGVRLYCMIRLCPQQLQECVVSIPLHIHVLCQQKRLHIVSSATYASINENSIGAACTGLRILIMWPVSSTTFRG